MLVFLTLLMNLKLYSQKVLKQGNDTLICFTVKESKFLLKQSIALKECDTLRSICELQREYADSIIKLGKKMEFDLNKLIENSNQEIRLRDYKISLLESDVKKYTYLYKKERFLKYFTIGVGAAFTGFITYLYITK